MDNHYITMVYERCFANIINCRITFFWFFHLYKSHYEFILTSYGPANTYKWNYNSYNWGYKIIRPFRTGYRATSGIKGHQNNTSLCLNHILTSDYTIHVINHQMDHHIYSAKRSSGSGCRSRLAMVTVETKLLQPAPPLSLATIGLGKTIWES